MNCLIWLTISCWLGLSSRPSICFRFSSVALESCSAVERWSDASWRVPPLSCTVGSGEPPFLTTTLGGGQGFGGAEPGLRKSPLPEPAAAEPPSFAPVSVEPVLAVLGLAELGLAEPGGLAGGLSGVAAVEQFEALGF